MQRIAVALLISLSVALAADLSTSPIIVWSNREVLGLGQGLAVSYQAAKADESASNIVANVLGKQADNSLGFVLNHEKLASDKPGLVVVFAGSQVDAAALRKASKQSHCLSKLLDAAASSLVMPYAKYDGASLQDSMRSKLEASGVQLKVLGCDQQSSDLAADVRKAIEQDASLEVLLVCSPAHGQQTKEALHAELEQLSAVQEAVDDSNKAAVLVYTSQPKVQVHGQRRSLTATYTGFGPFTTCDTVCQTQVRWLEGMLALLFMALAVCAGMTCLYLLDTPSRFETQKEGATN